MTDYTLKFKSKEEADDFLFTKQNILECDLECNTECDITQTIVTPNFAEYAIDVIGIIYKPTGEIVTTEDGSEQSIMQAIDGWHLNMRGPQTDAFEDYTVETRNPVRRWA